ncbi:MAG: aldehyde dehydrogenase family protein, partial [Caulobacterales bacterium]
VHLNGVPTDQKSPFGGYKQSGNGREWGVFGFDEFTEVKSVLGWGQDSVFPSKTNAPVHAGAFSYLRNLLLSLR